MAMTLSTHVQRRPLAVPVEGNAVRRFVQSVKLEETLVLDRPGAIFVKQAKGNLIFGVRLCQEVVEGAPVRDGDLARLLAIGNAEEDSILLAFDFMLKETLQLGSARNSDQRKTYIIFAQWRDGVDKVIFCHILRPIFTLMGILFERSTRLLRELRLHSCT
jgi:hypothetical protein